MNSGPEVILEAVGTAEVNVHRHWGCRHRDGATTWDPGYGTGDNVPLDEAEARALVARTPGATLVTRTETTTLVTTTWTPLTT